VIPFRKLGFLALAGITAACAQMEPPPGGPKDQTPPEITGSLPADLSLRNGSVDSLRIRFSEPVARGSVLENLRSLPSRLVRRAEWSGDTLVTLRFWDPFPADGNVCVYLLPGWLDRQGVQQVEWQVLDFAAGDSLARGWVSGQAQFKRRSSEKLHLVLEDSLGGWSRRERPDRQGAFSFRQLPTDGRLLRLWAYEDVDGDSLFNPAVDFADTLADSLLISHEEPRRFGLSLMVIDPHEPGKITGRFFVTDSLPGLFVLRLWPDSLRVAGDSLRPGPFPESWSDSLRALLAGRWEGPLLARKREGDFGITGIAPGDWALFVHRDLNEDSLWNPEAEAAWLDPGPLRVPPGEALSLPEFRFPQPADSSRSGKRP